MNNIFTKRTIVSLLLACAALIAGLILREKSVIVNIHDTYFVASYLTVGIFIIYLIVLINLAYILRISFKRFRDGR